MCKQVQKQKSILLENVHITDAPLVQAALTLELGQRVSQHSQLFALLLHVLLRHQAVVDGRVPLQLFHRLLQVTEEETKAASARPHIMSNHSNQQTNCRQTV